MRVRTWSRMGGCSEVAHARPPFQTPADSAQPHARRMTGPLGLDRREDHLAGTTRAAIRPAEAAANAIQRAPVKNGCADARIPARYPLRSARRISVTQAETARTVTEGSHARSAHRTAQSAVICETPGQRRLTPWQRMAVSATEPRASVCEFCDRPRRKAVRGAAGSGHARFNDCGPAR